MEGDQDINAADGGGIVAHRDEYADFGDTETVHGGEVGVLQIFADCGLLFAGLQLVYFDRKEFLFRSKGIGSGVACERACVKRADKEKNDQELV